MKRVFLVLSGLVAGLFAASLLIGPAGLGLGESLSALLRGDGGPVALVMQEIRLPRALLGLLCGGRWDGGGRCRDTCEILWQNRGLSGFFICLAGRGSGPAIGPDGGLRAGAAAVRVGGAARFRCCWCWRWPAPAAARWR